MRYQINLESQDLDDYKSLQIQNLDDLLLYVHTYNDSISTEGAKCVKLNFGDKLLKETHDKKVVLYLDKYIRSAKPDFQTIQILNSIRVTKEMCSTDPNGALLPFHGVKHGNHIPKKLMTADLGNGSGNNFYYKYCQSEGKLKEIIIPNIVGEYFNPYHRFKTSSRSATIQHKKLSDLIGLVHDFDEPYDPVFNHMTLTFPIEVAFQLFDKRTRYQTIQKLWYCFKRFRSQLHLYFSENDFDQSLGFSASLHYWSSDFPFLPHPHIHVIFPNFSYKNISKEYREDIEEIFHVRYAGLQSCIDPIINKVIPEKQDQYDRTKKALSLDLKHFVNMKIFPFEGFDNSDKEVPLPMGILKTMWTEIINEEFDLNYSGITVHNLYINFDEPERIFHFLKYKNRPAVCDLDLFLSKVKNVIQKQNKTLIFNHRSIFAYLNGILKHLSFHGSKKQKAKILSIINSYKQFYHQFSSDDFIDWLQFLSIAKTQTKVFGFMRNIARYRVKSITAKDPQDEICPFCGGIMETAYSMRILSEFDCLIFHKNSEFYLFEKLAHPPPSLLKFEGVT